MHPCTGGLHRVCQALTTVYSCCAAVAGLRAEDAEAAGGQDRVKGVPSVLLVQPCPQASEAQTLLVNCIGGGSVRTCTAATTILIVPDSDAAASAQVLSQIMYAMYSSDRVVAQRCACALAHMASIPDLAAAFVERKGLDILVDMLTDSKSRDTRDALQREAASASLLSLGLTCRLLCGNLLRCGRAWSIPAVCVVRHSCAQPTYSSTPFDRVIAPVPVMYRACMHALWQARSISWPRRFRRGSLSRQSSRRPPPRCDLQRFISCRHGSGVAQWPVVPQLAYVCTLQGLRIVGRRLCMGQGLQRS